MGIFGWSYPPGCEGTPYDDEFEYCRICMQSVDNDDCICPECPECGEIGGSDCYLWHGMDVSDEQIRLNLEANIHLEEAARLEAVEIALDIEERR